MIDLRRLMRLAVVMAALAVTLQAGEEAPPLDLPDLTGTHHRLAEYKGKTVIVNFWATWCIPCEDEMPLFVEAHKRYAERGLVILAPSLDDAESQKKIPRFVKKQKMNFPVLVGGSSDLMKAFGVGEALPATVFIDPEGRIVFRAIGQIKKKDLQARLDWMLDKRGPQPAPLIDSINKKSKKKS